MFLLFLILLLGFKLTLKKEDLANMYGICRKTLQKWVRYTRTEFSYAKYVKARKLDILDFISLIIDFGLPGQQKPLTKGELVKESEMTYSEFEKNVALNYNEIGLTKDGYSKMDIFPPFVVINMKQVLAF